MQSILRHPNIALLMGCCPPIPNIVIVYELVDNSLFTVLHMKRNIELTMPLRVKIALDCARVYLYMHNLGIVHRDIKSHNVLIDNNFNVKVCDFGLARFIVSTLLFILRFSIVCLMHLLTLMLVVGGSGHRNDAVCWYTLLYGTGVVLKAPIQ